MPHGNYIEAGGPQRRVWQGAKVRVEPALVAQMLDRGRGNIDARDLPAAAPHLVQQQPAAAAKVKQAASARQSVESLFPHQPGRQARKAPPPFAARRPLARLMRTVRCGIKLADGARVRTGIGVAQTAFAATNHREEKAWPAGT